MKPINIIKRLNESNTSTKTKDTKISLKNHTGNPVWIVGDVEIDGRKYYVNAKTFLEPSNFGIKNGPTSKLCITNSDNSTICNYDRGWDVRPKSEEDKEAYKIILKAVEEFRKNNPYEPDEY